MFIIELIIFLNRLLRCHSTHSKYHLSSDIHSGPTQNILSHKLSTNYFPNCRVYFNLNKFKVCKNVLTIPFFYDCTTVRTLKPDMHFEPLIVIIHTFNPCLRSFWEMTRHLIGLFCTLHFLRWLCLCLRRALAAENWNPIFFHSVFNTV